MFCNMLKKERMNKKVTQIALAESIGVRQKDISRWKHGEVEPSLEKFKKICKILEVSADKLLEL